MAGVEPVQSQELLGLPSGCRAVTWDAATTGEGLT